MSRLKILAIKLRALGDTVLMTAPLAELRRVYPSAEIHAAVSSRWAPLLEGQASVQRIFPYEKHASNAARIKALGSLALQLRRERYDVVVNFHASPASALLAYSTGAKVRSIHFHGHSDKNRYSTVTIPGKGSLKPVIERDMDAVRALGFTLPEGSMPRLEIAAAERDWADRFLAGLGLSGPVLGIGIGASKPTKIRPLERFAQTAVDWIQQRKGSVLAVAGPGEESMVEDFLKAVDHFLERTSIEQKARSAIRSRISGSSTIPLKLLPALLSRFSVFAANDSGPKHIAVAVGTPTVTIFGPEHPFEWHPYPTDRHPYLFAEGLSCRKDATPGFPEWCGLHVCVAEKHKCMNLIEPSVVLDHCLKVATPQ